jgi:DNA end-binding protein Ku
MADEEVYEDDDASPRARSFWSGTISFGLVSIPVDLYPANRPQRVSLRMLDADGTPLRRRFYDPETDRAVDSDELVRGYELADGSFVVVTDEELESLEPRKSRDIDLRLFIDADTLDPLYFERAYFLAPSGESNKAYRLLAETMERTGKAGIATFVMRTKEYLIAILAEKGILRAETLRFHDEVRTADELELPDIEAPDTTTRALRREIAKRKQKTLPKAELKDDYAERLLAIVEKKRKKGVDVVAYDVDAEAAGDEDDDSVIDLMEVLKRSMRAVDEGGGAKRSGRGAAKQKAAGARKAARGAATKRAGAAKSTAKSTAKRGRAASAQQRRAAKSGSAAKSGDAAKAGDALQALTKDELYERAQQKDIEGRSGMTKAQLVRALREAG